MNQSTNYCLSFILKNTKCGLVFTFIIPHSINCAKFPLPLEKIT